MQGDEAGMHVALCRTRGENNSCLYAVARWRSAGMWLWVCDRACVCILQKLAWKAVYLPCMIKSFYWHVWKINGMCLPLLCRAWRWSPLPRWRRSDSTHKSIFSVPDICSCSHLIHPFLPPTPHYCLLSSPALFPEFLCPVDRNRTSHHLSRRGGTILSGLLLAQSVSWHVK